MTADEIESAIEHAINALSLAKLALSKSSLPAFSQSDILRKSDLSDDHLPRASLRITRQIWELSASASFHLRAQRGIGGLDTGFRPRGGASRDANDREQSEETAKSSQSRPHPHFH